MRLLTVAAAALGMSVAALCPAQGAEKMVVMAGVEGENPTLVFSDLCLRNWRNSSEIDTAWTGQPRHFVGNQCENRVQANAPGNGGGGGTGSGGGAGGSTDNRQTDRQIRDFECKSGNCSGGGSGGDVRATDREVRSFDCKSSNC